MIQAKPHKSGAMIQLKQPITSHEVSHGLGHFECQLRERCRIKIYKKNRYPYPSRSNVFIPCKHNSKKSYQCAAIRPIDASEFRKNISNTCNKLLQDQMVSRYIIQSGVKHQRFKPGAESMKRHSFSVKYSFPCKAKNDSIQVCKTFFLHLTKFSSESQTNLTETKKWSVFC